MNGSRFLGGLRPIPSTRFNAALGAELAQCDGQVEHVYLQIAYPPKLALSKRVNSLKGVSSRLLRETNPEMRGRYRQGDLWSPSSFGASCGGAPLSIISAYVRQHRKEGALPPRPQSRSVRAQAR